MSSPLAGQLDTGLNMAVLIVTTVERCAQAAIAAETLLVQHPNALLRVAVVDDRFGVASQRWKPSGGSWLPVTAHEVNMSEDDFLNLGMALGPFQLVRALTPFLALSITAQHGSVVLLPETVEVLRPMSQLVRMADSHGVALVRRRESPAPLDGRLPDHADLLQLGRFQSDLGAFSGDSGVEALQWWAERVRLDSMLDLTRVNPWTHPWLDELAVAHPELVTVSTATTVASYQNLDEVDIDQSPLIRFDGLDVHRAWLLSSLSGDWPRVILSEHTTLAELVATRIRRLEGAFVSAPFEQGFTTLANGHRVDDAMRSLFLDSLIDAKRQDSAAPPNPFSPGGFPQFRDWLAEPDAMRAPWTRHLTALLKQRSDLASAFGHDPDVLLTWARRDALEEGIWTPLAPATLPMTFRAQPRVSPENSFPAISSGINVVGLLSAQLGNGEHARLMIDTLSRSRIPYSIVDHEATVSKRDTSLLANSLKRGFLHDVDLLMLNADLVESTLRTYERPGRQGCPTAAFWAWETTVFPERFLPALRRVDEVWGISQFVADAIRPTATLAGTSVYAMHAPMPDVRPRTDRSEVAPIAERLGVPANRHVVFFSFDYFSVAERKLPWAAVEAFTKAFPSATNASGSPLLVIKSLNHEYFPLDRERLLYAMKGRDDIVLIEQYVTSAERDALVMRADTYLSLHRSEGFGLTIAEAMAVGTPVVATGWSGNMSFMTKENSFCVDYELVDVAKDVRVYGGHGQWAEPSVAHAAHCLQLAVNEPAVAASRAAQATADLSQRAFEQPDSTFVIERLRSLRRSHNDAHPALQRAVHP